MIRPESLSRDLIEQHTVRFYRVAGGTRPDLRAVEIDGSRLVVKDFKRSDPLFRLLIGPILIRREAGALQKLKGLEGVPRLIGRLDRYSLAMEDVGGGNLFEVEPCTLDGDFYRRLSDAVTGMHARGVAHCDLRSRGNVVRGDDGKPYIVDFAACVFRGRGINPLTRWLFAQFAAADRNAVLRVKKLLSPGLLSPSEDAELAKPTPFERPARLVGQSIRRLTRLLLTRRKA